jgi:hypothetical protein
MIVCNLEMWPGGDESRAYSLGVIEIANVGGTMTRGDYAVKLSKSPRLAKRAGNWKKGAVQNFPRQRLGAYDLLLRALATVIGDRNPEAHEAVNWRLAEIEEAARRFAPPPADLLALSGDRA